MHHLDAQQDSTWLGRRSLNAYATLWVCAFPTMVKQETPFTDRNDNTHTLRWPQKLKKMPKWHTQPRGYRLSEFRRLNRQSHQLRRRPMHPTAHTHHVTRPHVSFPLDSREARPSMATQQHNSGPKGRVGEGGGGWEKEKCGRRGNHSSSRSQRN